MAAAALAALLGAGTVVQGNAAVAATVSAAPTMDRGGFSDSFLGTWRDDPYAGWSLWDVRNIMQLGWGASADLDGTGVGIALIDTGVSPVTDLTPAQVVNGPDLSFESQAPNLRYLDTYGHGTHMAGIMIGNGHADGNDGIARRATLTSIKVGTANGTVDVSQVIAAIDWVVKHKNDNAVPIRVINLSYGSGGNPATGGNDPLQFAVEQAWKAGIVVVAAAGNEGTSLLSNPASDPFVLAVGAAHTNGTLTNTDDTVTSFTNGKPASRTFDLVAPGESVISVRVPGSNIDVGYPNARMETSMFRGSGTSQAAAVTSAVVALLLQARPSMTPDQVKKLLTSSGTPLSGADAGRKMINVNKALATATPSTTQSGTWSNGTGSLENSRGAGHVVNNGVTLSGNNTIFGPFDPKTWAAQSAAHTAWNGGVWNGRRMAGDGWTGSSWASKTWAPATWPGVSFSGGSWVDPSWSGRFWAGSNWSTGAWSGRFWAGSSWYSTL